MTNHTGKYGSGRKFSSFRHLRHRAGLPYSVYDHLKWHHNVSGMAGFCHPRTINAINAGFSDGIYTKEEFQLAVGIWVEARAERTDITNKQNSITEEEEEEMTNSANTSIYEETTGNYVNADRNEMIALLQGAKGAQFVKVRTNSSRLSTSKIKGGDAPEFIYKAIDLDLKVGDKVIVQWRDRFGIGEVVNVFSDVPTSSEYDYNLELKHVVQVIDTKRSAQLEELDRQMLRKITASEASDRLERLTRQLGIEMDSITLALPDVDGSSGDSQ